jgi:uncharacterized Ntn-hydrolase superfamily protein
MNPGVAVTSKQKAFGKIVPDDADPGAVAGATAQ